MILIDSFILQEGCYYLITGNVKYQEIINIDNKCSDSIENIKKRLPVAELGKQINDNFIQNVKSVVNENIYEIQILLHEKGLRFSN